MSATRVWPGGQVERSGRPPASVRGSLFLPLQRGGYRVVVGDGHRRCPFPFARATGLGFDLPLLAPSSGIPTILPSISVARLGTSLVCRHSFDPRLILRDDARESPTGGGVVGQIFASAPPRRANHRAERRPAKKLNIS